MLPHTLSLHGPKVNGASGYQTEASTTVSCNTHGYLRYFVKVTMKNYHTSGERYARQSTQSQMLSEQIYSGLRGRDTNWETWLHNSVI